jgi:hypothetical protein
VDKKLTRLYKTIHSKPSQCPHATQESNHDQVHVDDWISNGCDCELEMSAKDQDKLEDMRDMIEIVQAHRSSAAIQREKLKQMIDKPREGEVIIVLDFKQNIRLGSGPRDPGSAFYRFSSRTILGFVLYWSEINDQGTTIVKKKYVDYISSNLSHDSGMAIYILVV